MEVYTIGHSNHPIAQFLQLLKDNGISCLADVRSVPYSRHNPQFNRENLQKSLEEACIQYRHFPQLAGFQKSPFSESPNSGWENQAFRNYADYALTTDFQEGLDTLLQTASGQKTAIMCAEKLYWRCHRRIIADYLVAREISIKHILEENKLVDHELTHFARIEDVKRIVYPKELI
jgi:uncharacterized protein (DUF488 family)